MKPQPLSEVSPLLVSRPPDRLGDYAHQAIQTCVGHILKQEKGVLAQRDPEFVHQMRVGLRRLRTVVQVFDVAIALPKALKDRALKQLGNVLGRVRDLDVLQNWLSNYTDQANLKKSEKKILRTLTNRLKKHRKKRVAQMQKYLQSNTYKRLTKTWQRWLKHPHYKKLACLPLDISLSDLQLPIIAQLLLHPGWLVTDSTDPTNLEYVHALRKLIKGVRYQMALFSDFYSKEYKKQVSTFKKMQDVLGEMQDETILQSFLVEMLGTGWAKKLPSLHVYFQQQQQQLWQQWLVLRQPYLSTVHRERLYRLFLENLQTGAPS